MDEQAVDEERDPGSEASVDPAPPIVCLGASAGGLEALEEFFGALPPSIHAAFVVVLHLSPDFKSMMPELLARHTSIPITTAEHGAVLEPNRIYIIPPGKNMVYADQRLLLHDQDRAPGHALNLPIDLFLNSLAAKLTAQTVGVILSGTGSDGSRGIRTLKGAGGVVLAQTPETARFDGMPRCAIESGVVDAAGTPRELALRVTDLVGRDSATPAMLSQLGHAPESEVRMVLEVLRTQLRMDFEYLRPRMLMRRVRRRMTLLAIDELAPYIRHLSENEAEAKRLRNDLFIGVTDFFRDQPAFEALKAHLVRRISAEDTVEPFRVWVPACASGEEAYSLLILLLEAMEEAGVQRKIKLFATDIDETSLSRASRGEYPIGGMTGLGLERIARHFVHRTDTVVIQPALREMVICAQHNLVRDPPFTRLDLISCRNFLIYLEAQFQEQVLASLHFALQPNGTLFLGSAETVGKLDSEFDKIDAKHRIFQKSRNVVLPSMHRRTGLSDPLTLLSKGGQGSTNSNRDSALQQVLHALTEGERISSAIVSLDGQLLEVLSDPLSAFQLPIGRPSNDILRLVRRPVSAALTTVFQRLRRGDPEASCTAALNSEQGDLPTLLRLKRLSGNRSVPERVLILIQLARESGRIAEPDAAELDEEASAHAAELRLELQQTRESLQSTIEELQSSNEEQQSTNEELIASNEELQSTNEELQSVNEELQSVNEELFSVNVQHQNKIQELAVMAADLDNLFKAIEIGTVFLDNDLRIRKFTPAIDRIVRLVEHDLGRSFADFAHDLGPDFVDDLRRVLETGAPMELEARGAQGTWLLVRGLPYLAYSGQTGGVVVTVVDVTATRNAREMTRVANEQLAHANRKLSHQREELEDLFSIVAHDLKRPVIALSGLLQLALNDEAGEGEAEALLPKALAECARMQRMLEDLGHVSGMARRPSPPEQVELQAWLDSIVERMRPEAEERGVRLNCVCDSATTSIPRAALEESATNLLENALKYGSTNPEPRIDVSCAVRDGGLELMVRDNGCGIAAENHKQIFEPFRRLHPDLTPGSGLGLVAVRRVIAPHGGTISLESSPGRGSKFVVRLPIDGVAERSRFQAPGKPKALLVEDDTLDSRLIQRFLGDTVKCTHVRTLAEAEDQLRRELYDIVLLDLSLPDGHGLELVQRTRDLTGSPVPIIVVTGHGDGLAPSALTETIAGYVAKADMGRDMLARAVADALATSSTE